MKKTFGLEFKLVNDVKQILNPKVFQNGPWMHIATVQRGFKYYMIFHKVGESKAYIEQFDDKDPQPFKLITDLNEWQELIAWGLDAGLLTVAGIDKEIKIAKK